MTEMKFAEMYKSTMSHLRADEELRKEILSMTENSSEKRRPKKFIARRILVTAIIAAMAVVMAMGANAATDGALYEATLGRLIKSIELSNGAHVEIYDETHFDNGTRLSVIYEDGDGVPEDSFKTDTVITITMDEDESMTLDVDGIAEEIVKAFDSAETEDAEAETAAETD